MKSYVSLNFHLYAEKKNMRLFKKNQMFFGWFKLLDVNKDEKGFGQCIIWPQSCINPLLLKH